MDYVTVPRIAEADKKKIGSLYIEILTKSCTFSSSAKPFGATTDKPVWHFPEKVYDSEPTLGTGFFLKCSVIAASKYNISNCEYFVWVTKDNH